MAIFYISTKQMHCQIPHSFLYLLLVTLSGRQVFRRIAVFERSYVS